MRYRALNGITVPENEAETQRIMAASDAGEPLPFEERRTIRYEIGDEVEYIPAISLPWLLEQGQIEEIPEVQADAPVQ